MPRRSAACAVISAPGATTIRRAMKSAISDMERHLAVGVHLPGLNGVVMVEGVHAAHVDKLAMARLNIASLVDSAALQQSGRAVPAPRRTKTHDRLRENRLLQLGVMPAQPAIGRHLDPIDA